ncbi:MAG: tRNA lysidine(34) synthetase TilS [Tidjanibacter sp.]|nr:tRNA lysidine(34) synthetase TilS [Tidjanibacter sp.]
MKVENLTYKFREYIKEHQLATADNRILLTVSGGVDSMVMMHLFVEAGYKVGVAHCNFQLRGTESEEDEVLVAEQAAALGVPCYNRRFDTKGEMAATGESVQIAARRLRYGWFAELCTDEGYDTIAVAHHADDSIETFFINLLRGTGLKGLTGISLTNGRIIRPLLFATRHEINDYAKAHKIPFREDSSNRSTKYLRNKIRLGIVPRLREIVPSFTQTMGSNIDRLTDAQHFINHAIGKIEAEAVEHFGGEDIIDPAKIDRGFPLNFVIYELMSQNYGFKGDVVDSLCDALRAGATGRRFYSRDWVAYIDRGRIVISRIGVDDTCEVPFDLGKSKVYCGNSVLYIERTNIDNIDSLFQPDSIALLDADTLTEPLTLRKWREGDRFVPLGMSGEKKVSDYLINAKVSMAEKSRQFVLCAGEQIVWLVGHRIDERYKITSATENVVKIVKEIV